MFSLYVGTQYFILGHILCSLLFFSFFCLHEDVLSSYPEIELNIFPVLLFSWLTLTNGFQNSNELQYHKFSILFHPFIS